MQLTMTGFDSHSALKKNVRNLTAQFEMISKKSKSSVQMKSQNSRRSDEMKSQKSRSVETHLQKSRAIEVQSQHSEVSQTQKSISEKMKSQKSSAVETQLQNSTMSTETRSQIFRSEEIKSQKSRAEEQSQIFRMSPNSKATTEARSLKSRSEEMKSQNARRTVVNYVNSKQEVPSPKLEDSTADDQYHETQRLLRNLKNRRRNRTKEPMTREKLEGIVKEYVKEAEEETDVLDGYSPTKIVCNLSAENTNDAKLEVSDKETDRNEEAEDIVDVIKNKVHFSDDRMETVDEVNKIPDILNFTQEKTRALSNTDGQSKLSSCIRYLLNVSLTALFVILSTRLIFFS